ncbi:VOC family protein [Gimesia panareensis]|uniref:Glyoxalase-like domain protein n=1 Tax=Gimesia panareensis TaxID=2527978 RepID=A0A518ADT2_9PLAN|nr:VOC family protein [Gimesia panareensis]QDT29720.1 Glyoxalase-like domain protein [Gimesia panareensis]QDU52889.1 Glyoxalase-like domain protein [Gimesia panareensis]
MTDSAPTQSLQVQAFDHITLVVKDLEASRKFYVDFLGMDHVPRPAFSFEGHWYQIGDQQIHLILEHDQSGAAGQADVEPNTRTHHFAFQVKDSKQAYEQALQQGIPIVSPPKSRPDGAIQTFVNDPDGHIIELCSLG